MRARSRFNIVVPILLAALAVTVAGCSRRAPDAVFLVVVDTLRPDRLSTYGQRMFTTVHTDTLAANGTLFENAFAVSSWTVPSMGAMMTSLYPTQLGLVETPVEPGRTLGWRHRREQSAHTLALEDVTLAEVMRDAGFRTAAFVNQPGLNAGGGFTQGFDDYFYPSDEETIARLDEGEVLDYKQWPPFLQNARIIDDRLIKRFDEWLAENGDRPVFVWLHLLTPHRPYNPPPWSTRRTASSKERFAQPGLIDAYDGEVIVADDFVGQIVASIDRHVGRDRSVVVLASDHGEAFGEHGMFEHGHTLHSEVTRVPLIVRAPGVPSGERVKSFVRTIDIFPTILDLAGVASDDGVEGASLAPFFSGGGASRPVYSEGMLYGPTERSLLVGGKKVIHDLQSDTFQLFNCLLDPSESINIKPSYPELADSVYDQLEAMHGRLVADFERRARSGAAGGGEKFRKALESLGYLEGINDSIPMPPPPPPDPHEGHQH